VSRRKLTFMVDDPQVFQDRVLLSEAEEPDLTLGALLSEHPALCTEPLTEQHLHVPVRELRVTAIAARPDQAGYLPPGTGLGLRSGSGTSLGTDLAGSITAASAQDGTDADADTGDGDGDGDPRTGQPTEVAADGRHPERISDREAVLLAHREEIEAACLGRPVGAGPGGEDPVSHLAEEIAVRSGRVARTVRLERSTGGNAAPLRVCPGCRRAVAASCWTP
jgi:hypothetical protein